MALKVEKIVEVGACILGAFVVYELWSSMAAQQSVEQAQAAAAAAGNQTALGSTLAGVGGILGGIGSIFGLSGLGSSLASAAGSASLTTGDLFTSDPSDATRLTSSAASLSDASLASLGQQYVNPDLVAPSYSDIASNLDPIDLSF